MTLYLPNTALHETGGGVDEFVDMVLDPPLPPPPAHDVTLSNPTDRGPGAPPDACGATVATVDGAVGAGRQDP